MADPTKQPKLDAGAPAGPAPSPSQAQQSVLADIAKKFASTPDGQALKQVQEKPIEQQPKR